MTAGRRAASARGAALVLAAWALAGCRPAARVTVAADGTERTLSTRAATVAGLLRDAGVTAESPDIVLPAPTDAVRDGLSVRVVRVRFEEKTFDWPVAPRPRVIPSPYLHRSETIELSPGRTGRKRVTARVAFHDGLPAGREVLREEWLATPVPGSVIRGMARRTRPYMLPARLKVRRSVRLRATAYTPGAKDNAPFLPGETATGLRATYGIAAVDPRVIALGTRLYVKGYGYCIAADTGGAIKGRRIDLCYDDARVAYLFGVRDVTVYLLGDRWPGPSRNGAKTGRARASAPPRPAAPAAQRRRTK